MLLFFRIGILFCIAVLLIYLGFYWWRPRTVERRMLMIRKSWYTIYFIGAAIVLLNNPAAAIDNWQAFMITAIIFALVDIFVFLSMYIKKVGNSELVRQIQNFQESADIVVSNKEKLNAYTRFLNEEGVDLYEGGSGGFLKGFVALTEKWAEAGGMRVKFYPFKDQEDRETLLSIIPQKQLKDKPIVKLSERIPYFFGKNKQVLMPVHLKDQGEYIVHLMSEDVLTETDCLLLSALLSTYDLVFQMKGQQGQAEQPLKSESLTAAASNNIVINAKPLTGVPDVPFSPHTSYLLEEAEKAARENGL